jgi:precorrin-3B synthase
MESGDGLIVRLRVSGGVLDVGLAEAVAGWSSRWGNGLIDLSGRGNLQLRGVSAADLPALQDALGRCGLLDANVAGEAVRNVVSSPLAGLDPSAVVDVGPIVRELERRLAGDASLHGLPGKFRFAVDDGGVLGLDGVPADVRLVAMCGVGGAVFAVHLDGARDGFGPFRVDAVVNAAEALARVFLRLRVGHEGRVRRMRDLVEMRGATVIGREAGLEGGVPLRAGRVAAPSSFLGVQGLGNAAFLGVGLPFGRIAAEELSRLASAAGGVGACELRLTPWRAILVPVASVSAARALAAGLAADASGGLGSFIVDAGDPRLRIVACPGAPSCASATTPVRDDAAWLAAGIDAPGEGLLVHVSGCAKGCAHPRAAAVTLVGRDGRYDLVRDGVASDAPVLRGLTGRQAAEHIRGWVA